MMATYSMIVTYIQSNIYFCGICGVHMAPHHIGEDYVIIRRGSVLSYAESTLHSQTMVTRCEGFIKVIN